MLTALESHIINCQMKPLGRFCNFTLWDVNVDGWLKESWLHPGTNYQSSVALGTQRGLGWKCTNLSYVYCIWDSSLLPSISYCWIEGIPAYQGLQASQYHIPQCTSMPSEPGSSAGIDYLQLESCRPQTSISRRSVLQVTPLCLLPASIDFLGRPIPASFRVNGKN